MVPVGSRKNPVPLTSPRWSRQRTLTTAPVLSLDNALIEAVTFEERVASEDGAEDNGVAASTGISPLSRMELETERRFMVRRAGIEHVGRWKEGGGALGLGIHPQ